MSSSQLTLLVSVTFWLLPSPFREIKKWLNRSDMRRVVFEHYKKHAEGVSHKPKRPRECSDEGCQYIN